VPFLETKILSEYPVTGRATSFYISPWKSADLSVRNGLARKRRRWYISAMFERK
jgi:hypothetical protein